MTSGGIKFTNFSEDQLTTVCQQSYSFGKIIKIVATRCQILRVKCTRFDFGGGSAGGTYSAPPGPLAGFIWLFGIPSPTHSFFPGLKHSFSANPSHCSPSFLLLKYLIRGFPGLFTVISEHICFLLLFFFCFYTF